MMDFYKKAQIKIWAGQKKDILLMLCTARDKEFPFVYLIKTVFNFSLIFPEKMCARTLSKPLRKK